MLVGFAGLCAWTGYLTYKQRHPQTASGSTTSSAVGKSDNGLVSMSIVPPIVGISLPYIVVNDDPVAMVFYPITITPDAIDNSTSSPAGKFVKDPVTQSGLLYKATDSNTHVLTGSMTVNLTFLANSQKEGFYYGVATTSDIATSADIKPLSTSIYYASNLIPSDVYQVTLSIPYSVSVSGPIALCVYLRYGSAINILPNSIIISATEVS